MPARSRRVVALALGASALLLLLLALLLYTGVIPVEESLRGTVAGVLSAGAAVDTVLALWFFRTSLSS